MLSTLSKAIQVGEVRAKLIFTLIVILVFRIGAHVPVPGVDLQQIARFIEQGGALLGMVDVISGGAFKNFSVFAMSITPYINSSIIMQLLTVVIPQLEALSKEGVEGRKVIVKYTRYGTVLLAFIQATGIYFAVRSAVATQGFLGWFVFVTTLTAGTAFLMWLGEQITEKGIGNGISILIFAGIVSRVPSALANLYKLLTAGTINAFSIIVLVVIAALVIAGIVFIQEGQRRIPVQYAKRVVGRKVYGGQSTHIPMKVNQAGVIPVIFASSLLMFPPTLASYFKGNAIANWIATYFAWGSVLHTIFYTLLIVGFTFFYTAITFNPVEVADNMKKYGGFIPGLRPGRPTAEYLNKVMVRLSFAGAIFLAIIAVLPNFVLLVTKIPNIYFGGTALLIVVGVALETMKQMESQLLMRHYQGFMK
ncbi:MAG TPA: preprotein translocase subunit SecY [Bacillota bacterium]|nr:preprotein translocase subunit SecY [Bacillota bacterium]